MVKNLSALSYFGAQSLFVQPSTLTYPVDHTVLVEGEGSTTRFMSSYGLENKGGNPEYP